MGGIFMERKSNGFLKVCGILMIIGGGISLILGVIAVLGVALLADAIVALGGEASIGLLTFSAVVYLITAIVQLIAGIMGVANAAKPEKAMVCIVFGIITAILAIIGAIMNMVGGNSLDYVALLLGLVLPILYLIGAFQNKARAAA